MKALLVIFCIEDSYRLCSYHHIPPHQDEVTPWPSPRLSPPFFPSTIAPSRHAFPPPVIGFCPSPPHEHVNGAPPPSRSEARCSR
ncbi:hypothetical protein BO82DRAFT_185911 [Aspergillus uvarum CBS 121591]|uniref:Uncharacterized protein n=1 Tax=Aspergillus uvarum CBS 121591 TaxID=1448315 RepID=A0A319DBM6_9EURO|nr:hypothetical protein BO82DRAFT_185911 [Aspergillus uvarum CBS 121591]PYH77272.1 hypothetical protein BO82DRAFT_185911 [Aspergillus uvarum CBS 121591]